MSEPTPGDWKTDRNEKVPDWASRGVLADGVVVALVVGRNAQERDANVNLIVAVKRLLTACEAAYEKLVTAHGHDGGYGEYQGNPLPRQLKAAIDKAKGDE